MTNLWQCATDGPKQAEHGANSCAVIPALLI